MCEINQMGTFTCSGHSARINAQKSIALYARKAYGNDRFAFNPFPTRDYDSYKSILLRAANSDTYATRLRDIVASSLAEGEGILYQDHVVIQVYINGQYWGHYNLREKINKYFIAQYEGVTDERRLTASTFSPAPAQTAYAERQQRGLAGTGGFLQENDLNDPENLQYVTDRLDVDSLFTHAAYEIILGNVDFTNVRVYRVPGGKWKYLLFDVEACWRNLDKTPLEYYIKPVSAKIQGFRHEPLNALLAVPEMKAKFLTRVAEILESTSSGRMSRRTSTRLSTYWSRFAAPHCALEEHEAQQLAENISATEYYARVRPKKIPEMLQKAMKLTDEEVETYFGEVLRLLEETNTKK